MNKIFCITLKVNAFRMQWIVNFEFWICKGVEVGAVKTYFSPKLLWTANALYVLCKTKFTTNI